MRRKRYNVHCDVQKVFPRKRDCVQGYGPTIIMAFLYVNAFPNHLRFTQTSYYGEAHVDTDLKVLSSTGRDGYTTDM